jgi:hypothetical protein
MADPISFPCDQRLFCDTWPSVGVLAFSIYEFSKRNPWLVLCIP